MFYFVNAYIANFIYAYWDKDFMLLAKNVATILLFSQIFSSIINYLLDRILVRRNITVVENHFFDAKDPRKEKNKTPLMYKLDELNESV